MSLNQIVTALKDDYPDEDWSLVDSALWLPLKGGDVHRALRGSNDTSHKSQIDLTYGKKMPTGESPVDDFFPYLRKPQHLDISRQLRFGCKYTTENLKKLGATSSHLSIPSLRKTGVCTF